MSPVLQVPVSMGEFIDKLTILEIKIKKIKNSEKLNQLSKEYQHLQRVYRKHKSQLKDFERDSIEDIAKELKVVNNHLWNYEEAIREYGEGSTQQNHQALIAEMGKKIYQTNDKRFLLKKQINLLVNSSLREVKSHL